MLWQGIHLDPSIYLMDEENRQSVETNKKHEESQPSGDSGATLTEQSFENGSGHEKNFLPTNEDQDDENMKMSPEIERTEEGLSAAENKDYQEYNYLAENFSKPKGDIRYICSLQDLFFLFFRLIYVNYDFVEEIRKDSESQGTNLVMKKISAAEPIIVPIVLRMAEFDHKVCFICVLL